MQLWTEIKRKHPSRGQQWQDRLRLLNEARNGLAHDDSQKIARVVAEGWPLTLHSVRRWRSLLDSLTQVMDDVSRQHLKQLFGVTPW